MGKQKSARFRFGRKVRELRIKRGWTQAELARRSGVSRSYIQKIESDRPPDVTIITIAKLARGFKLSCHHLLN